jgi:hypothetical protein
MGDLITPAQTFDPVFAAVMGGDSMGFGIELKNRQGLWRYAKL